MPYSAPKVCIYASNWRRAKRSPDSRPISRAKKERKFISLLHSGKEARRKKKNIPKFKSNAMIVDIEPIMTIIKPARDSPITCYSGFQPVGIPGIQPVELSWAKECSPPFSQLPLHQIYPAPPALHQHAKAISLAVRWAFHFHIRGPWAVCGSGGSREPPAGFHTSSKQRAPSALFIQA